MKKPLNDEEIKKVKELLKEQRASWSQKDVEKLKYLKYTLKASSLTIHKAGIFKNRTLASIRRKYYEV